MGSDWCDIFFIFFERMVGEMLGNCLSIMSEFVSMLSFPLSSDKCPGCDCVIGLPLIFSDIFRVTPCPSCSLILVFDERKGWVRKKVSVRSVLCKNYKSEEFTYGERIKELVNS